MAKALSDIVVDVADLRREYLTRSFLARTPKVTVALQGISLRVEKGELFGLIGPNGAGKTTIKILTTLLAPTSGKAHIFGLDLEKDVYEIRRRIGIVFGGERGLYNRVTAVENLRYFANLYGVHPSEINGRIAKLIKQVGLEGRENERVEKYSRGMKQRLHIAKSVIHNPELVFLDEPTIGLDPGGARDIRNMVREMKEEGKTIFLTTHNMFEADELCDRIAVISKGTIVVLDTPSGLKRSVKDISVIELQTYGATTSSSVSTTTPSSSTVSNASQGTSASEYALYIGAAFVAIVAISAVVLVLRGRILKLEHGGKKTNCIECNFHFLPMI